MSVGILWHFSQAPYCREHNFSVLFLLYIPLTRYATLQICAVYLLQPVAAVHSPSCRVLAACEQVSALASTPAPLPPASPAASLPPAIRKSASLLQMEGAMPLPTALSHRSRSWTTAAGNRERGSHTAAGDSAVKAGAGTGLARSPSPGALSQHSLGDAPTAMQRRDTLFSLLAALAEMDLTMFLHLLGHRHAPHWSQPAEGWACTRYAPGQIAVAASQLYRRCS